MLHEIPEIYHCEYPGYSDRTPTPDSDYLLVYEDNKLLFMGDTLPHTSDFGAVNAADMQYLFEVNGHAFYFSKVTFAQTEKMQYRNVQALREVEPQWLAFAGVTGYHLAVWYQNNIYCGKCAEKLTHKADERALVCPKCGRIIYPNMSAAVIVGIINGDKILLSKYAGREYTRYALIAGFTEIGESLEQTVHREVMEEVGLKVKNIRYFDNQPWGYSQSLLVGFFADLDGSNEIRLDENELSEAVWMTAEEMPINDTRVSLTSKMMEHFRQRRLTAEDTSRRV